MQENVKIIKIETNGAITSVKDLKDHIKELQDILVNTEKDTEEYNQTVEELVASQTKLNEVMAATKKNASAAEGSYNALVNQMGALKVAWRATTSEVTRAQLGEKIREINDQLKAYDATIGNNQRKVGSYEEALQTLNTHFATQRQELVALKNALDNLEPGTDAYNEAFQRATEITNNLRQRQEELRMSANDLGTQLGNIMSVGAGLVSGFNAINAIMTLTGQKNEDLQKTMVKLQAGIALVQSAKGIEGAIKSLKGYANWAANAYDKIAKLVSGQKVQQKQIDATTKSTQANAAANTQNAAAEQQAAAGATSLSTGMKGAAASTNVATASMTAFKAVIMSLGIGIVVAAVSGLITLLGKLANSTKEANEKLRQDAQNRYEMEQDFIENLHTEKERQWDLEKARGKDELEIQKERYDEYAKQLEIWSEIRGEAQEFLEANRMMKGMTKEWAANIANTPKNLNVGGKSILELQTALENMENNGNKYFKSWTKQVTVNGQKTFKDVDKSAKEAFDRIKENGIQTFSDIYWTVENYRNALAHEAISYEFDPLGGLENDYKVTAEEYLKEAEDASKSEIQLENDTYKTRKELLEKYGYDTTELTRAHNKKINDIVTGATNSIIESAKAANQKELANLMDAQEKELRELRKYGVLKKQVVITNEEGITKVITAEEAVREKYAKQRAAIEIDRQVKTVDRVVKELNRYADVRVNIVNAFNTLENAGVRMSDNVSSSFTDAADQMGNAVDKYTSTTNKLLGVYNMLKDAGKSMANQLGEAQAEAFDRTTKEIDKFVTSGKLEEAYGRIKDTCVSLASKLGNVQKKAIDRTIDELDRYVENSDVLKVAYDKAMKQLENYIGSSDALKKAFENTIKDFEDHVAFSDEIQRTYDILEAAGVAFAKDLGAAQEAAFEKTRQSLEIQVNFWKQLWEGIKDDESITEEKREEIHEKYVTAVNNLETEQTKHLLEQIKTRKQALQEEIDRINKNYDAVTNMQSLNNEYKTVDKFSQKKTDFGRALNSFWGASQNQSYDQMKDSLNESFGIEKSRLEAEIEAYQEYAANINATEAEITYAKEKEAEKRMELTRLERENMIDNLKLEIDESHELINTIVDVGNSISDILGSVADAWEDNLNTQVRIGKMSQEEADKQMENVRKIQIIQAIINTLSGSIGAFTQASATIPPPYGQIVGAAAAAAVAAAGAAQIAQIRNASKDTKVGGSTMMAQVVPVMTDYQPTMVGNATGEQETEDLVNALSNVNLYVKVTDIDDAQKGIRTRVEESTF